VNAVLIWVFFAVISIVLAGVALLTSRARAGRRDRTSKLSLETEVDYQARNDRIPNLEETLKLYAFPQKESFGADAEHSTPSSAPVSAANQYYPAASARKDVA
jgi:hypothetical protein